MNSFTFIGRGIDAADARPDRAVRAGRARSSSTRTTTSRDSDRLTPHRAKEEADDYRYFPEPDLVPVRPEPATGRAPARASCRELPGARIVRLRDELGAATAQTLVTGGLDALWAATRDAGAEPVAAANVIANQLVGAGVDPATVDPGELAKLVAARDEIPRKTFDDAIAHAGDEGFSADPYLEQKAVADTSQLEPIVDEVLAQNADAGRGVSRRQDRPARLLRRPGDEGDERPGRRARRQRARAQEARRVKIFAFEPTREITRFDSHGATIGGVARARGEVRVSLLQLAAGGLVGAHPAACPQLFLVVAGSGWARSGDEPPSLARGRRGGALGGRRGAREPDRQPASPPSSSRPTRSSRSRGRAS